jgi:hypothetical protein
MISSCLRSAASALLSTSGFMVCSYLNPQPSIAFGCLRFTPALNFYPSKLPPSVGAMESRDLAGFEMWGSDISVFCASPSRAAERGFI